MHMPSFIVLTIRKVSGCVALQTPSYRPWKLSNLALRDLSCFENQNQHQILGMLATNFHMHCNAIQSYACRLGFGNCIAPKNPISI